MSIFLCQNKGVFEIIHPPQTNFYPKMVIPRKIELVVKSTTYQSRRKKHLELSGIEHATAARQQDAANVLPRSQGSISC